MNTGRYKKEMLHIWTCIFAVTLFSTKMRVHIRIYTIKYSHSLDLKNTGRIPGIIYKIKKRVVNLTKESLNFRLQIII